MAADINGDALHSSVGLPPALNVTTAKVGKLEIIVRHSFMLLIFFFFNFNYEFIYSNSLFGCLESLRKLLEKRVTSVSNLLLFTVY